MKSSPFRFTDLEKAVREGFQSFQGSEGLGKLDKKAKPFIYGFALFTLASIVATFLGVAQLLWFSMYVASWVWLAYRRWRNGNLVLVWAVIGFFLMIIPIIPLPFLGHLMLLIGGRPTDWVRRGTVVIEADELTRQLEERQSRELEQKNEPLLTIGGVPIPNSLETYGFFFVGSPGSGKTQAIKRLLAILKQRNDFRVILLDRNGELLESFYDAGRDLIFNPSDARSVQWSHSAEEMEPETIAASLVPDDSKDRFFSEAARSLLADLYERCEDNAEAWEVISTYSIEQLSDFLKGGVSARYFGNEKTGASVISTMVNSMRFYRSLPERGEFSFSEWGRRDDPRWLFLPIFEDAAERYKPLYSMAFELMLKGLLSTEGRLLKTAIVIDELGALNELRSLGRLLSEGRKFGGTAMIGTQTEAQIDEVYGENKRRILLQGTATKLILNCRDNKTAESMAAILGKNEQSSFTTSFNPLSGTEDKHSEQIREAYSVMPSELQALPKLEGFLTISDGTPPARVKVTPQNYPKYAERLIRK